MDRWRRRPSAPQLVKNIVLVGRTGNGKSATGNSLVGREVFLSEANATSRTMTCQACKTETPDGMVINVIDTPGLFDLSESAKFISKEIIKCLTLAEEGLHVVVLVLSLRNRITQEEENTLSTLQVLFGSDILDYLIVLFTGGDELERNNQTLEGYFLQGCPKFLKTVLGICGDRTVVFNNRTTDKHKKAAQVQQFLAHVASIEKHNGRKPFRGEMHRQIKEEAETLRQQQKAVEARNLGEAEFAKMKKELQISYESRMSKMEMMVENTLREISAKHEKMAQMLRENLKKAQRDDESRRNEHDQNKKDQMLLQLGFAVPGIIGMCSIL